jgi:hypothetical protein
MLLWWSPPRWKSAPSALQAGADPSGLITLCRSVRGYTFLCSFDCFLPLVCYSVLCVEFCTCLCWQGKTIVSDKNLSFFLRAWSRSNGVCWNCWACVRKHLARDRMYVRQTISLCWKLYKFSWILLPPSLLGIFTSVSAGFSFLFLRWRMFPI